jgi:hypothetical protein
MNGQIKLLIGSPNQTDLVHELFGQNFQTLAQWRLYLQNELGNNVTARLAGALPSWSVTSFQALYVACWVHHPVEKGTFMINISHLSAAQQQVIRQAYETHLTGRKSSHLSGAGRSASRGWDFLNGYRELLVQLEDTAGQLHLFLKAEGHTTALDQVIPHLQSWWHKKKTGEGLEASAFLHATAKAYPQVEARAAENYGTGYKALVKLLGLSGRQQTVRDVLPKLFQATGFPQSIPNGATNDQLGHLLN